MINVVDFCLVTIGAVLAVSIYKLYNPPDDRRWAMNELDELRGELELVMADLAAERAKRRQVEAIVRPLLRLREVIQAMADGSHWSDEGVCDNDRASIAVIRWNTSRDIASATKPHVVAEHGRYRGRVVSMDPLVVSLTLPGGEFETPATVEDPAVREAMRTGGDTHWRFVGVLRRTAADMKPVHLDVLSVEDDPPRDTAWTVEQMHADLGDSMDGLDPAAVLRDIG